jgi:hypothetical protein
MVWVSVAKDTAVAAVRGTSHSRSRVRMYLGKTAM